jgi:hypothetical protein
MATAKQLRYYAKRQCTDEAIWRFKDRYLEYCNLWSEGSRKNIVRRLQMAVSLAKQGKATELPPVHRDRRVFDVEMPADVHFPGFTLRILTDADVNCVLTCLPFRPRVKAYPEPVTLPHRVKASTNLGELLQVALRK